jgi:hypothetical protein
MQNIPLFGGSADKISPTEPTLTSGYLPLQLLPAENLNYYLNAATQAVQEWVHVITLAGLTPGTSQQGWTAISGLMSAGFNFTLSPLVPTQSSGDGSTKVASTAFVQRYLRADTSIQGLTLSNDSGTPNTVLDIAAGAAVDTTYADMLLLSSAFTKTTGAWAVGTGNGGLDTGAVGAASWYSVWVIKRTDTGVVDVLFSLSASAPTMPANYTLKRRIGWFKTASSNIVTFQQNGNQFYWMTKKADANAVAIAATTRTLLTVNSPVNSEGIFAIAYAATGSGGFLDLGWTALTDAAAADTNSVARAPLATGAESFVTRANVDASNQIYYRSSVSTGNTITVLTIGWIDTRSL